MTDKGQHHAFNTTTLGNDHCCFAYRTQSDLGLIVNTGFNTGVKLFIKP